MVKGQGKKGKDMHAHMRNVEGSYKVLFIKGERCDEESAPHPLTCFVQRECC